MKRDTWQEIGGFLLVCCMAAGASSLFGIIWADAPEWREFFYKTLWSSLVGFMILVCIANLTHETPAKDPSDDIRKY